MLTFTANREELALAITRAAQALSSRPAQEIYAGMLIRAGSMASGKREETNPYPGMIDITASDGDMTFTASVDAAIEDQGTALLPGKMLQEISRYFTGKSVKVSCDKTAVITAGRSEFTLSCASGDKYPPNLGSPQVLGTMDAEEFSESVRRVSPAASRTHPVLRGLYLHPADGRLYVVASDDARMAVMSPEFRGDGDPVLVSTSAMERFARIAADESIVTLGWDGKLLGMSIPGLQVTSRTLAGTFPQNWKKILDRAPQDWVTTEPSELTRAVKAASLTMFEGRIDLTFDGDDLNVTSTGFSDYVDTEGYSRETQTWGIGAQLLLDALSGSRGKIRIAPGKAVYLRDEKMTSVIQTRRET